MTETFGINLYPSEPTYTAAEVKVLTEAASCRAREEALNEVEALLTEAGARGRFARQLIQHMVKRDQSVGGDE